MAGLLPVVTALSTECGVSARPLAVVIVLIAFASGGFLGMLAAAYEPVGPRARRQAGLALTVVGHGLVVASLLTHLWGVHTDHCGQAVGVGATWMEFFFWGGLLCLLLSSVAAKAATWLPAAITAILDASFVGVFLVEPITHRSASIAILSTHSACSAIAAWYSWRARGLPRIHRAKASEAARLMAASWLVVLVLSVGSSGETGNGRLLTNGSLSSIFVVSAAVLVIGTGYTKYAEAMEARFDWPAPFASGWVGRRRNWMHALVIRAASRILAFGTHRYHLAWIRWLAIDPPVPAQPGHSLTDKLLRLLVDAHRLPCFHGPLHGRWREIRSSGQQKRLRQEICDRSDTTGEG